LKQWNEAHEEERRRKALAKIAGQPLAPDDPLSTPEFLELLESQPRERPSRPVRQPISSQIANLPVGTDRAAGANARGPGFPGYMWPAVASAILAATGLALALMLKARRKAFR